MPSIVLGSVDRAVNRAKPLPSFSSWSFLYSVDGRQLKKTRSKYMLFQGYGQKKGRVRKIRREVDKSWRMFRKGLADEVAAA